MAIVVTLLAFWLFGPASFDLLFSLVPFFFLVALSGWFLIVKHIDAKRSRLTQVIVYSWILVAIFYSAYPLASGWYGQLVVLGEGLDQPPLLAQGRLLIPAVGEEAPMGYQITEKTLEALSGPQMDKVVQAIKPLVGRPFEDRPTFEAAIDALEPSGRWRQPWTSLAVHPGYDIPGGDLERIVVGLGDLQACQQLCWDRENCQGATLENTYKDGHSRCNLKLKVNEIKPNSCCTSFRRVDMTNRLLFEASREKQGLEQINNRPGLSPVTNRESLAKLMGPWSTFSEQILSRLESEQQSKKTIWMLDSDPFGELVLQAIGADRVQLINSYDMPTLLQENSGELLLSSPLGLSTRYVEKQANSQYTLDVVGLQKGELVSWQRYSPSHPYSRLRKQGSWVVDKQKLLLADIKVILPGFEINRKSLERLGQSLPSGYLELSSENSRRQDLKAMLSSLESLSGQKYKDEQVFTKTLEAKKLFEMFAVFPDWDIPDQQYKSETLPINQHKLCQQRCMADPNCSGYVYEPIVADEDGPVSRCNYKKQFDQRTKSNCCISGIRFSPLVLPQFSQAMVLWRALDRYTKEPVSSLGELQSKLELETGFKLKPELLALLAQSLRPPLYFLKERIHVGVIEPLGLSSNFKLIPISAEELTQQFAEVPDLEVAIQLDRNAGRFKMSSETLELFRRLYQDEVSFSYYWPRINSRLNWPFYNLEELTQTLTYIAGASLNQEQRDWLAQWSAKGELASYQMSGYYWWPNSLAWTNIRLDSQRFELLEKSALGALYAEKITPLIGQKFENPVAFFKALEQTLGKEDALIAGGALLPYFSEFAPEKMSFNNQWVEVKPWFQIGRLGVGKQSSGSDNLGFLMFRP
ncbi:MAG: PAN domain-containing protein [bacterium]|nr:PAN domain-containing protein [bacterium]